MPPHCDWFEDTGTRLNTSDGREVRVFRFNYQEDQVILQAWAIHLREHYSSDEDMDSVRAPMGLSRTEYLRDVKFPSTAGFGPSVRAGDFSEILVADYVEFLMGYNVPRTRYDRKDTRDSSTKSIDVLGFKFAEENQVNANDELLTGEVKASFRTPPSNNLQAAIDGSKNDYEVRLPFALNATYQRLKDRGELETANMVERFMNKTARPYENVTTAILMCSNVAWNENLVTEADSAHPNQNIILLVFLGDELMTLTNRLYELAYATA